MDKRNAAITAAVGIAAATGITLTGASLATADQSPTSTTVEYGELSPGADGSQDGTAPGYGTPGDGQARRGGAGGGPGDCPDGEESPQDQQPETEQPQTEQPQTEQPQGSVDQTSAQDV